MMFYWTFYSSMNSEKYITVFTKYTEQHNCFLTYYNNNNNGFLSSKSAY